MTYVGVSKEWLKNHAVEFLSNIDTYELVEELCKREGVKEYVIPPYEWYQITGEKEQYDHGTGAARILVVID